MLFHVLCAFIYNLEILPHILDLSYVLQTILFSVFLRSNVLYNMSVISPGYNDLNDVIMWNFKYLNVKI